MSPDEKAAPMPWLIFAVLAAALAAVLVNAAGYGGDLLANPRIGYAVGLSAIALAAAASMLVLYRGRLGAVARDIAIWGAIAAALAAAWWLFG